MLQNNFLYDKHLGGAGVWHGLWTKLIHRKFVKSILEEACGLSYSEDLASVVCLFYHIDSVFISITPLYYYIHREGQATGKLARWKGYIRAYNKIMDTDRHNYFANQIPYSVYVSVVQYVKSLVKNKADYDSFKINLADILNDRFVSKSLSYNFDDFKIKDRIRLQLILKRYFWCYYLIEKVQNRLKDRNH